MRSHYSQFLMCCHSPDYTRYVAASPPLEPPPTTYLGRSSGGGSGGGLGVLYEHRSLNTAVVTVVLWSPAGPQHRRTLTRISFYYLEPSSQSPNPQTAAEPFFHLQGRRSPREPAPPAHHTLPHRTAHRHLVDDLGFFSGGGASRAAAWPLHRWQAAVSGRSARPLKRG